MEIQSDYGHDAFLLEVERLGELTRDFLARVEREGAPPTVAAGATGSPVEAGEVSEQAGDGPASWAAKAGSALGLVGARRGVTA